MIMKHLCFLSAILALANAIPIDNGVEGDPEISCGPNSISVNFNTRNPWEGKLYVKNLFENGEPCVVQGTGNGRLGSIELGFDQCGVQRQRSANPRGVYVWVTVIMSFHPTFITKVDRAVRAQCFYMEADKTVSQDLEVSMLTTAPATFNVPMPTCHYEIRERDTQESDEVKFAIVGQSVYHHWVCDTDYENTFCSVPYGCFVDDGSGNSVVQLLDDDGCSLDGNLLDNPEYREDLWAVKESHVFKYADRPNLYFNCQMRVTIKEPGQDCPRPQCGSAPKTRGKRSVGDEVIVDVSATHPVMVADVDFDERDIPSSLNHRSPYGIGVPVIDHYASSTTSGAFCLSSSSMTFVSVLLFIAIVATVVMSVMLYQRKRA